MLANKALLNTFRAQGLAGQSLLATDLAHKGLLDEAIAELRTAIQLKPDYAKPYASLGSFLMLKGQLADAVAQSSRAVDLDKNFWLAWSSRGSAYAKLGQYDKARADFETAVKLPPANPWTCNDLAWFLANCPETKLRDPARAAELASKAVQLAPQDANSWNCLGVAQYRTGQYQAAITALDRCLTLSQGGDGAQLFFLAMAHGKLGHRDEARKRHHDGVAWMEQFKEPLEKDRSIAADMRRFQSEADAVLTAMTKEP